MIRPLLFFFVASTVSAAPIERIWLTHATSDPSKIVINWETDAPSDSVVEFGTSEALGQRAASEAKVTLHHVEIPLEQRDVIYHYRVRSGENVSTVSTFKGYPTKDLRIAIVGDWGYAPGKDVNAIVQDDVHLLLTVGDNVASLQCAHRRQQQSLPPHALHADPRQSRPRDHRSRPETAHAGCL